MRKITLSTGCEVRVYPPPIIKIHNILSKKYPPPQAPIREAPTAGGGVLKMAIEDDPEYLREVEAHDQLVSEKSQELHILFALKNEQVPDDFDAQVYAEILQAYDEEWRPREGTVGRKLDWIEFDLLGNMSDASLVQNAINDQISINLEVVEQIEETFPGNVEGPASTEVT